MISVARRTCGTAKKARTAATGHPVMNALSQRGTKSTRRPILVKVTTALTTKTINALMRTGKMNLPLLSMEYLGCPAGCGACPHSSPAPCDLKEPIDSRGGGGRQLATVPPSGETIGEKTAR